MQPVARWGVVVAGLVLYDLHCAHNAVEGDSLSEVVRDYCRVHHPVGKTIFVAGWAALTVWFVPHILRQTVMEASAECGGVLSPPG